MLFDMHSISLVCLLVRSCKSECRASRAFVNALGSIWAVVRSTVPVFDGGSDVFFSSVMLWRIYREQAGMFSECFNVRLRYALVPPPPADLAVSLLPLPAEVVDITRWLITLP